MGASLSAASMSCVLCAVELEGFVQPLCTICKQDNYVLHVAGKWHPFSNEGRLHAAIGAASDDLPCLARQRRRRLNRMEGR